MSVEAQQEAAAKYRKRIAEQEQLREETPTQYGRTFAQGLTFGTADEIEAFLRTGGGEAYDQVLNEIRGNIDAFRTAEPLKSAATEIGGAALPSILATVFSGGSAIPALGAQLATKFPRLSQVISGVIGTRATNTLFGGLQIGAIQGGLSGFGEGEGGFANRAESAARGAVIGGATGAGLTVAGNLVRGGIDSFIDFARQKYGKKASAAAQRELQKLAQERGISEDEAFQFVLDGSLLAENVTFRDILRTYRAQGGEAAELLRQGLADRPAVTAKDVSEYLEKTLAGEAGENIIQKQTKKIEGMKQQASDLYETPFAKQPVPQELLMELSSIFNSVPDAFKLVAEEMRIKNQEMPFKMVDGQVVVSGRPTIEQAEIIRRNIADKINADMMPGSGRGSIGKALMPLETRLRELIDNISPETQQARAKWNELHNASNAFDNARKVATTKPEIDRVQNEWNTALLHGPEATQSFRLGMLTKLRQQITGSTRGTTIKNLLDADHPSGQMIREVFPEQNIEELVQKLRVAKDANEAANAILGGSPTAITEALVKRQGADADLMDLVLENNSLLALAKVAMNIIRKSNPGLNDKQRSDLVMLMLSRDAEGLKNIISSENGYALLEDRVNRFVNAAQSSLMRGTTEVGDDKKEKANTMFNMLGAQ